MQLESGAPLFFPFPLPSAGSLFWRRSKRQFFPPPLLFFLSFLQNWRDGPPFPFLRQCCYSILSVRNRLQVVVSLLPFFSPPFLLDDDRLGQGREAYPFLVSLPDRNLIFYSLPFLFFLLKVKSVRRRLSPFFLSSGWRADARGSSGVSFSFFLRQKQAERTRTRRFPPLRSLHLPFRARRTDQPAFFFLPLHQDEKEEAWLPTVFLCLPSDSPPPRKYIYFTPLRFCFFFFLSPR